MMPGPWRACWIGVRLTAVATVAAASLLSACNRDGRGGKLDLPTGGVVVEPPVDAAARFVIVLSTLRREPTEQARVKSEGSKAAVANAIALLHRGERVSLVERRDDWSRVRASDGEEGWLKSAALAPVSEMQEGTVLLVAWAFDRPDLLAANARRKIDPGTLLFIRKTRDLFTEVDAGPGPSIWVLTDRVTTQPGDVAAAKLVEKARYLIRNERPGEARELLALLRSRSPDSPLVGVLATELGETPPDGGPPEGPTGPAGDATSPSGPPRSP
jgi:SH3-like domain-containing protein